MYILELREGTRIGVERNRKQRNPVNSITSWIVSGTHLCNFKFSNQLKLGPRTFPNSDSFLVASDPFRLSHFAVPIWLGQNHFITLKKNTFHWHWSDFSTLRPVWPSAVGCGGSGYIKQYCGKPDKEFIIILKITLSNIIMTINCSEEGLKTWVDDWSLGRTRELLGGTLAAIGSSWHCLALRMIKSPSNPNK